MPKMSIKRKHSRTTTSTNTNTNATTATPAAHGTSASGSHTNSSSIVHHTNASITRKRLFQFLFKNYIKSAYSNNAAATSEAAGPSSSATRTRTAGCPMTAGGHADGTTMASTTTSANVAATASASSDGTTSSSSSQLRERHEVRTEYFNDMAECYTQTQTSQSRSTPFLLRLVDRRPRPKIPKLLTPTKAHRKRGDRADDEDGQRPVSSGSLAQLTLQPDSAAPKILRQPSTRPSQADKEYRPPMPTGPVAYADEAGGEGMAQQQSGAKRLSFAATPTVKTIAKVDECAEQTLLPSGPVKAVAVPIVRVEADDGRQADAAASHATTKSSKVDGTTTTSASSNSSSSSR